MSKRISMTIEEHREVAVTIRGINDGLDVLLKKLSGWKSSTKNMDRVIKLRRELHIIKVALEDQGCAEFPTSFPREIYDFNRK